jgi:ribose transport system ATP-binding protein
VSDPDEILVSSSGRPTIKPVSTGSSSAAQPIQHERSSQPSPTLLSAVGIVKSFGEVQALVGANFHLERGEIHGLVGENGAGKSTLIKVLSGVVRAERGQVLLNGQRVVVGSPAVARRLGWGTVFQELPLLPWMTVAENLLIDDLPRGPSGLVQRRKLADRAAEVLSSYKVENIDPLEIPERLSLADRQIIEIVRTLRRKPAILFLDEPTASLSAAQVDWLFALVRTFRAQGGSVVFTSHRWKEVEELVDRVTVFRNGREVATRERLDESEAVVLMTGRSVGEMYPPVPQAVKEDVLLDVRDLRSDVLDGVSFSVRSGEILGIGGLAGQGQRELFLTLFGARRATGGEIAVGGQRRRIRRPKDAIRSGLGIALVPEDRKQEGLLLPLSVRDNLTLPVVGSFARAGLIQRGQERRDVGNLVSRLQVKTARPATQAVQTLSGGNQQKVLIGRWLLAGARVLLLYDITRGVDLGTKHDLYKLIVDLAEADHAIVLYSSDTDETAHLCQRVLVMREGRIVRQLTGEQVKPEAIVAASVMEATEV